MKKSVIILLTLIYTLSTSGVIGSSFYCCGKLKGTNLFSPFNAKKGCKKDTKNDNCCNTKTFVVKVADQHSPSGRLHIDGDNFAKLIAGFNNALFIFQNDADHIVSNPANSPPVLAKQPDYLNNCTFRI